MQIVTDSAADLAASQLKDLPISYTPLRINLGGKSYIGGEDLSHEDFYRMLGETDEYPKTSQVSAGEFAEVYRRLSKKDPEILSIHISSGLSGTMNSAKVGASMVPEAKITFWDSRTLSAALGWQVQAAGIMAKRKWELSKILERLTLIRDQVDGMFTMKEIRYLVHGGRISHIKGLMAQVLNIKPTIAVDHETGVYVNAAQDMTFKRAVTHMVQIDQERYTGIRPLRAQIVHGNCPEGVELLQKKAAELLDAVMEPTVPVAPALGAHVGPSLTGIIVGPMELFSDLL